MRGSKLLEDLPRGPEFPLLRVFQTLPNAFLRIGAGGNIQCALTGFSILRDGRCLFLNCKHHVNRALVKLFHEVVGRRLKVVSDWT